MSTQETSDALVGQEIAGCRIVGPIGRGQMGTVFRARQVSMDRPVAVKVLPPGQAKDRNALERFFREARTAAKLDHPNIVRVYDVGVTPAGVAYLVMELIDGRSLKDVLDVKTALSCLDTIDVAIPCAEALEYARVAHMVHRDIKPANILIARNGTVKIADLGLAKITVPFAEGGGGGTLTVEGAIMGTPFYMSPEQARDSKEVDHRTDIYGLGATLYRCIFGKVPHDAESSIEIISRVLYETPEFPSLGEVADRSLVPVVRRAMAKEADQRYQTAGELLEALKAARAVLLASPDGGAALPPVGPAGPSIPAAVPASGGAAAPPPPAPAPTGASGRLRSTRARLAAVLPDSQEAPPVRPSTRLAGGRTRGEIATPRGDGARRATRTPVAIALATGIVAGLAVSAWLWTGGSGSGATVAGGDRAGESGAGRTPSGDATSHVETPSDRAQALLDAAVAHRRDHPEDVPGALSSLDAIVGTYAGTLAAAEASHLRDEILAGIEAGYRAEETRARALAQAGAFDEAIRAIEGASTRAYGLPFIRNLAVRAISDVEAAYRERYAALDARVQQALDGGRIDEAAGLAADLVALARSQDLGAARAIEAEALAAQSRADEAERQAAADAARRRSEATRDDAIRAIYRALSERDLDGAQMVVSGLAGGVVEPAWVQALGRDVQLHRQVEEHVLAWLAGHEGRPVDLSVGAGRLERNGREWIIWEGTRPHPVEAARLPASERIRLGGEARGSPYPEADRIVLLIYGADLAEVGARIDALTDEALRAALRVRLDVVGSVGADADLARRDEEAQRLLAAADRAWDRGDREEAADGYRQLLDAYALTPTVAREGERLRTREAEGRAAAAPTESPYGALFRGQFTDLGGGRVEVRYEFADPAELQDFDRVEGLDTNLPAQSRNALAGFLGGEDQGLVTDPALAAQSPWTLVTTRRETVLFGRGTQRLAWRGRLVRDMAIEFDVRPIVARNIVAVIGSPDAGEDAYYLGVGFSLPPLRVPQNLRAQYPDFFDDWDPLTSAAWRILRGPGLGSLSVLGREVDPFPDQAVRVSARIEPGASARAPAHLTLGILRSRYDVEADDPDPITDGTVGLAVPVSAALFDNIVIRGTIDPEWAEDRLAEIARQGQQTPPAPPGQ